MCVHFKDDFKAMGAWSKFRDVLRERNNVVKDLVHIEFMISSPEMYLDLVRA